MSYSFYQHSPWRKRDRLLTIAAQLRLKADYENLMSERIIVDIDDERYVIDDVNGLRACASKRGVEDSGRRR